MTEPAWTPCNESDHVWDPIRGWVGRYYCLVCKAIAYRGKKLVLPKCTNVDKDKQFVLYKCPKCHGPTCYRDKPCPNCKEK